ncbi:MAG: hypothetical protein HS117_08825 [Verrucomicrobiaceae bacterium]|jgi:hypothetical protein|nr:hypothetical protein [Verrucomicrobiaceae bacterium]
MNRLFRLLALPACAVLASCASSTMDSIPDEAKMAEFKAAAQRSLVHEYTALAEQRQAGQISEAEYQDSLARLDARATSHAHTLAWQSHDMAEKQRKARGEPTPDNPIAIQVPNAFMGGAGGQSTFRSALQNYNLANGVGGGTNLTPSLPASTLGGAMRRGNFPGSIYDEDIR